MYKSKTRPEDPFCSRTEKLQIQRLCEQWTNLLQPKSVVGAMFGLDLIRERDKEEFDAKHTDYARSEFLYEKTLMRATYCQVQKVREALVKSDIHGHVELARLLPLRDNDDFWKEYAKKHEKQQEEYLARMEAQQRMPNVSQTKQQAPDHEPMDTGSKAQPETGKPPGNFEQKSQQAHPEPGYPHQESGRYDSRDGGTANPAADSDRLGQVPQRQQVPQQFNNPPVPQPLNLGCYETRSPDNPPSGTGYVLVIANFLNDPTVSCYQHDIQRIERFFKDRLGYQVEIQKNLCKDNSLTALRTLKGRLLQSRFDRLFIFILSHGDRNGIKTCLADGKTVEDIQPINIETDVVNSFMHDDVPSLRSFPKVFFIQACAGEKIAKAAGNPGSEVIARAAAKSDKITVGADTLVCKATQDDHFAWVDNNGSWLIQETMDVFENYYQSEHLIDMLTEVNNRISKKSMRGQVTHGQVISEVRQLPVISHNLTKKFYLAKHQ